jgi:putative membrane protein
MSRTAAAPSAMTDAQQKHIRDTSAFGSLSLLLSQAAKSKVSHPLLKQFVEFEIAEQETVGGILKAIQTNAAPSGETPSPGDADLMQNLDDAGKASVEKLRALKAGSAFDRDYIRYEIEGHRKLLDIQEVYLKSPDNLDQANVAKLARGMIKERPACAFRSQLEQRRERHTAHIGSLFRRQGSKGRPERLNGEPKCIAPFSSWVCKVH